MANGKHQVVAWVDVRRKVQTGFWRDRPRRRMLAALTLAALLSACAAPADKRATPPAAPQAEEQAVKGGGDLVAVRCEQYAVDLTRSLAWDRLHSVMTTSPRWGTILRADYAAGAGRTPMLWRFICWDKFIVLRPHQMPDPSENLSPLP